MSSLNARVGRTLPSPNLVLIRHQVCVRNSSRIGKQMKVSPPYVGALLVAGVILVVGTFVFSSNPRPAADPNASCQAESAR